ncbi:MAG: trypsin-like peptidase domain-containing protein [bacterium]
MSAISKGFYKHLRPGERRRPAPGERSAVRLCRTLAAAWLILNALPGTAAAAEPVPVSRRSPVVELVDRCSPAVVNISTETEEAQPAYPFLGGPRDPVLDEFFNRFFAPQRERPFQRRSLGSGVLIDGKGHVLTNYHVVLKASRIHATLVSGKEYPADLVGSDPGSDLAVLRITLEHGVNPVPLGTSSDLMIGETVVAIGNPFGLSHTVTTGVISALNRSVQVADQVYEDFIQTDAAINPGNSGGPLLNIRGELIGINTAIHGDAQGIGFAIPVDRARRIVEELLLYGEVQPVWFGMELQELSPEVAKYLGFGEKGGILVSEVHPDGPAARGGLQVRDVLVSSGDSPLTSASEYWRVMQQIRANQEVVFRIFRQGRLFPVRLKAEAMPEEQIDGLSLRLLGVRLAEIAAVQGAAPQSAGQGLVIDAVVRGSQADQIGLRPGDFVLKINDHGLGSLKDFRHELARLRCRPNVSLQVLRGRYLYYVTLDLKGFSS